jgi:hypothetical protein
VPVNQTINRPIRGIQQSLLPLARPPVSRIPLESKGVVYTKRWVVELLLDLAGYRSEINLVDAFAVEPAAGDGAFLGPMVERLMDSCENQGRPLATAAIRLSPANSMRRAPIAPAPSSSAFLPIAA